MDLRPKELQHAFVLAEFLFCDLSCHVSYLFSTVLTYRRLAPISGHLIGRVISVGVLNFGGLPHVLYGVTPLKPSILSK